MQIIALSGSRGVYGIQNVKTGGIYVGSSARDMGSRVSRSLSDLRAGNHACHNMQIAWDEGLEKDFTITALWKAPDGATIDEIRSREEYYRLQHVEMAYNTNRAKHPLLNIAGGIGKTLDAIEWAEPYKVAA